MKYKFFVCSLIISIAALVTLVLIHDGRCEENNIKNQVIKVEKEIVLLSGDIIKSGERIIQIDSIVEEYAYLSSKLGIKDQDWRLVEEMQDGGTYKDSVLRIDIVKVEILKTKELKKFYFDVSTFSKVLVE
jgi:hypothetical protein